VNRSSPTLRRIDRSCKRSFPFIDIFNLFYRYSKDICYINWLVTATVSEPYCQTAGLYYRFLIVLLAVFLIVVSFRFSSI